MTTGEKVSTAASLVVLVALVTVGMLASHWQRETRDALRELTSAHERPAQILSSEWQAGESRQRLTTERELGESFQSFLARHRNGVRDAGGEQ